MLRALTMETAFMTQPRLSHRSWLFLVPFAAAALLAGCDDTQHAGKDKGAPTATATTAAAPAPSTAAPAAPAGSVVPVATPAGHPRAAHRRRCTTAARRGRSPAPCRGG